MLPVMATALSGALAYQAAVDEIAHNLANLSTPAYRPTRLVQAELPPPQAGVVPAVRRLLTRPGPMVGTGAPFDVALADSRTFLRVRLPEAASGGFAYTRRGDLRFDETGQLVTFSGLPLDPEIRIPPGARAEVRPDGTVVAVSDNGVETVLGRIEVFTFDRPENLEPIGGGLFRESASSGPARMPQAPGDLLPGHLEMSGVDLVGEFARLIAAQRAYTLNLSVIRDQDQLLGQAVELVRG